MPFNLSAGRVAILWFVLLAICGVLQGCNQATSGKVTKDFGVAGMTTGSLLHQASYDGILADVTMALDSGADINEHNSVGHTPLHLAAAKGRVEITKLLLGRGAYINVQNANGLTPLHMATKYGQREIIKLLLQRGANTELRGRAFGMFAEQVMALHLAASQDNAEVVSWFIHMAQADVDARSMEQRITPLHYASSHNRFEAAIFLLGNGAKINALDRQGETPLHYAVRAGAREVVGLLLKMGADVDSANTNGVTPLQLATEREEGSMAELLQVYSKVSAGES